MSKSLYFCKAAAQDPSRSSYADRPWDEAVELVDTEKIFDEVLHKSRKFHVKGKSAGGTKLSFDVNFLFDCDADFDYFTSESVVHDGTLIFINEAIERCVDRVCLSQTYNRTIGKPKNGDSIKYVIGNFVVLTEYDGDFVPTDKPWMRERTTVLLPIKMMKE